MRTFVINLNRNHERLEFMRSQLTRLGIDFERFPAIYGKELSPEIRARDFAKKRSLIAAKKRLSDAEIGVALSHLGCYKRMIEAKTPYALILEDDVVIAEEIHETLSRVTKFLNCDEPQVVVLSGYGVENAERLAPQIREESSIWCADAYCLNLKAAQLIYDANYPVRTVADSFKRWRRFYGLKLYRALPATARQDDVRFGSENLVLPKSNWLVRNLLWLIDRVLIALEGGKHSV